MPPIDKNMLALGIRQPWAELILRGIKTVEVRTVDTAVDRTIYIYSSRKLAEGEAAVQAACRHELEIGGLPTGVIVGTVDVVDCRPCTSDDSHLALVPNELLTGKKAWVLANPKRLDEPIKPRFLPYGIWFYPFQRRNGADDAGERRGGHGRG
jgi:hypothetical protein